MGDDDISEARFRAISSDTGDRGGPARTGPDTGSDCPFCGSPVVELLSSRMKLPGDPTPYQRYFFRCGRCRAMGPPILWRGGRVPATNDDVVEVTRQAQEAWQAGAPRAPAPRPEKVQIAVVRVDQWTWMARLVSDPSVRVLSKTADEAAGILLRRLRAYECVSITDRTGADGVAFPPIRGYSDSDVAGREIEARGVDGVVAWPAREGRGAGRDGDWSYTWAAGDALGAGGGGGAGSGGVPAGAGGSGGAGSITLTEMGGGVLGGGRLDAMEIVGQSRAGRPMARLPPIRGAVMGEPIWLMGNGELIGPAAFLAVDLLGRASEIGRAVEIFANGDVLVELDGSERTAARVEVAIERATGSGLRQLSRKDAAAVESFQAAMDLETSRSDAESRAEAAARWRNANPEPSPAETRAAIDRLVAILEMREPGERAVEIGVRSGRVITLKDVVGAVEGQPVWRGTAGELGGPASNAQNGGTRIGIARAIRAGGEVLVELT